MIFPLEIFLLNSLILETITLTKRAQELINNHYKKNPSHEGLLNFKTIDVVMDDQNRFLNVVSKEP